MEVEKQQIQKYLTQYSPSFLCPVPNTVYQEASHCLMCGSLIRKMTNFVMAMAMTTEGDPYTGFALQI